MRPLWTHGAVAVLAIGAAVALWDPAPAVREVLTFQDPAIDESSGLLDLDAQGSSHPGLLLTVNDSGDGPVIYVVDKSTGETVGRTTYSSDPVVDVEAMAPGPGGSVWVGDIGDNRASRDHVSVYAVPAVGRGDRSLEAQRFDLAYPDGPHNAEALLAQPRSGRLFLVTKGLLGGTVYAAPPHLSGDHLNRLTPVGNVGGLITDGCFARDGRFAFVRGYGKATVLDAHRWKPLATMALPDQRQGEGLALSDDPERLLVSSEGVHSDVLSVRLADDVQSAMSAAGASPSASRSAGTGAASGDDNTHATGVFHLHRRALKGLAGLVILAAIGAGAGVRAYRRRSQRRSTT